MSRDSVGSQINCIVYLIKIFLLLVIFFICQSIFYDFQFYLTCNNRHTLFNFTTANIVIIIVSLKSNSNNFQNFTNSQNRP
mgnify:CR=1 FL=1